MPFTYTFCMLFYMYKQKVWHFIESCITKQNYFWNLTSKKRNFTLGLMSYNGRNSISHTVLLRVERYPTLKEVVIPTVPKDQTK